MKKQVKKLLIFLLILLAFFLRFYNVTVIPPSLNWDEVSIGYNAYSILKTGKDEWGVSFPLFFRAYGEYKLPAQIYASIPAIAVFGLNDFAVRVTPVLYGTLTVLVMFFLTRVLFKNYPIATLAAFLLAVSPWHIQLTRASFESSFALFWVVLGIWLFVKGFDNRKYWIWSMIPLAVSVFTYNSERVFTPLFIIFVFIVYFRDLIKQRKTLFFSAAVFILLLTPMIPFVLSGESSARYKLVSVTDDPGLIPRINEARGHSTLPQPLPILIHNKIVYITGVYLSHYLAHFSPQFLFISGAPHKQHHVQNIGELYLFQAPFLLLGGWLILKRREKFGKLILGWMLLSFIPVALTNDSIPHALRTLVAVPTYQFVTAYGIYYSYLYLKGKNTLLRNVLFFALCLMVFLNFKSYIDNYYSVYPKLYSRDWQYGYKQAVDYINHHQNEYDQIIFTRSYGEPHMFSLFYLNYDPQKFRSDPNLVRFETYDWIRVLKFDKFYFPDLTDTGTQFADITKQNSGKKLLFIGRPDDFPKEIPRLLTIDFLNGNRAFDIVQVK